MNRTPGRLGLLLTAVTTALILVASCARETPTPTPTPTPSPTPTSTPTSIASPTPTPPPGGVIPVDRAELSITDLSVDHHTVYARVGASITWRNNDEVPHVIASDEGLFRQEVRPGESFTWQPIKAGIYQYHTEPRGLVEGVIVVPEPGAPTQSYFGAKAIPQYFSDACGGCHGADRQGGVGPALIPGRLTSRDEFYFNTIKNGRPGTIMPSWGNLGLTDQEIWGLVGYIFSQPEAATVRWEMEEIRGSLAALVDESTLPSSPQHAGNMDNLMLVTERENRSIAVINGDDHTLLGHIEASYRAHGYAFDPTNERWAYNVGRDGWVFKIDLYTLKAVRKVRVGHDSRGIAISDNGKYLIVGNYIPATAVILDAQTLEPLKVIETVAPNPEGVTMESRVAIVSDVAEDLVGPYFIIALKEAGQVWRVDYSQPDFPIERLENVGHILHDGFLSPDNKRFYLASQQDNWMAVIDVENWELVDRISTGDTPHPGSGAVWEADGTTYGATVHAGEGKVTVWDLETNEIAGTIPTQGPGLFIRAAENSPYVWADALFGTPSNTITVFRKEKPFEVVKVIQEGVMTLHPEFTEDGRFVYISDWTGYVVRVYDAQSLEKVAEISGVVTPTGVFNTSRREEKLGH